MDPLVNNPTMNSPVIDPSAENPWLTQGSEHVLGRFLLDLLLGNAHTALIQWTNPAECEFKFLQPQEVAKLWGVFRHKPGMNYDKLSRSIRYHYGRGILEKVPRESFSYRFLNLDDATKERIVRQCEENQRTGRTAPIPPRSYHRMLQMLSNGPSSPLQSPLAIPQHHRSAFRRVPLARVDQNVQPQRMNPNLQPLKRKMGAEKEEAKHPRYEPEVVDVTDEENLPTTSTVPRQLESSDQETTSRPEIPTPMQNLEDDSQGRTSGPENPPRTYFSPSTVPLLNPSGTPFSPSTVPLLNPPGTPFSPSTVPPFLPLYRVPPQQFYQQNPQIATQALLATCTALGMETLMRSFPQQYPSSPFPPTPFLSPPFFSPLNNSPFRPNFRR